MLLGKRGFPVTIIVPTILEGDRRKFNARLEKLVKAARRIQIDFLDGQFVKGIKPRGYFFAAWTYYSRPRKK